MDTLVQFVKESFNCSSAKAWGFISKFRHYDAVEYGSNIIENHRDNFAEGFDLDIIDEETLASLAIRLEDDCMTDLSTIEDDILTDVFGESYGYYE